MWGPMYAVTGQNGSGQNGTDKMVYGQNGIQTKCHCTKWYGQNGTDKMVASFGVDYN